MTGLLFLAVVLIFLYEGLPLFKRKLWRELGAVGLLLGFSIYLAAAEALGMSTPLNWLEQLVGPVGRMIFR